jgi:tRNA pseudouridine55 synthase
MKTKSGFFLLHKPAEKSSVYYLNLLKRQHPDSKWGHAGTLDPLASGLLIVLKGEATKLQSFFMKQKKTYEFEVCFGAQTPSLDQETEISEFQPLLSSLNSDGIREVCQKFIGTIQQTPPLFSAIKQDGQRLYHHARQNSFHSIEIEPRSIRIEQLDLLNLSEMFLIKDHLCQKASFRVVCEKGTYVRSLARDLAVALQTIGFCTKICRTNIGNFDLKNAKFIENILEAQVEPINLRDALIEESYLISDENWKKLSQGQTLLALNQNCLEGFAYSKTFLDFCWFQVLEKDRQVYWKSKRLIRV